MDELIDRELEGLRRPVKSQRRIGDAIRAMQAPTTARGWMKWPLGIGSAAAAVAAVVLVGSLATGRAYGSELNAVKSAQLQQKTMHQVSYLYGGAKQPMVVMEFWFDHQMEAYRQYSADGTLTIARSTVAGRTYHYVAPNPTAGTAQYGSVSEAEPNSFGIVNVEKLFADGFLSKHQVQKKTGVMLDGRICDFYSLGKGYYRLWVDTDTKLPLKREIYDKGVTLWKRDVYDYPESFPPSVFKPFQAEGLKYIERPLNRAPGKPAKAQRL